MPVKLIPTQPETPTPDAPKRFLGDDTKFPTTKIAFFQYFTVAVFLFLLSGFWILQVQNPDYYYDRAERNRIRAVPILAPRGKILDRDGRVIVDNHASFSLYLSRENLKPEHVKTICDGLNLDYEELSERLRRFDRTRPKYEPIIIKEELTPGEISFVEAHSGQDTFPEMELIHTDKRLYPRGGLAAHIAGYTGEVSEAELDTTEFARYKQGDVIGKDGIERQYNEILMGIDGQRRVIVDNRGRERQVIDKKEATPGKSISLTIDLDLQAVAELAMTGRQGAVVALDPRSGEVLALVSRPAFDPNKFAVRIRAKDWNEIRNDPDKPLINRAVQAQLAPGSTFKPVVALAGLDAGTVDDGTTAFCPGVATFYGRPFKCHRKGGHGTVDLHRAIVLSCDVFFYNVGNRTPIDKIAEYANIVGLGAKTGIDLPGEMHGTVPSTKWKIRNFREKWYAGETISVAIGQGALTVTPVQLAYAIGGVAMGGVWHQPHLLKEPAQQLPPPRRVELNPDHVVKVVDSMYGVVNEGGTAARSRLANIEFCGKTGTAQLLSNEALKKLRQSNVDDDELGDTAWFVGFAPRVNPEIAVVAMWQAGGHGDQAAPIARDIIRTYFEKKSGPRTLVSAVRR
jgi:penicillin-binding protein 2